MRMNMWGDHNYGCMCGSPECEHCHPEYQTYAQCECCGTSYHLYELWDGVLCDDCESKGAFKCDCCGEWRFNSNDYNGMLVCDDCLLEEEAETEE
jgi:hypothetical protein